MISDLACADALLELYSSAPAGFADLLWPEADQGICTGLMRVGDTDLICFRGSITSQDWFRDILSETAITMLDYPGLGEVAKGFAEGMTDLFQRFRPLLRDKVQLAGHSLGAARALIFAGMLVTAGGIVPQRITIMGSPRPARQPFAQLVAPIDCHSYRNRRDEVTTVPTSPPFVHPFPFIQLEERAEPYEYLNPFRDHHIALYRAGIAKLGA